MTDKTTASQSPHPDRQGNRAGYRARLQGTFLPSLLDRSASTLGRSHAPMLDRLQTTTENIVSRIKERVEEKEGIPPVQQRLIFGGKQMADDKTAAEYNLEGGATLHLVLALRGGY
ncbi:hypothetical protein ATEG_09657 [Aspergillus terreus NIH2624]|uniref:Ubiquitin-like domain-containing protein n=1 Tax=Aspergillus terreus (strain NIH 2624 / FGSC A1156) TaxID=341663 RepID=Q0C9H7_ASPTN|nr:uncharacterized protein ATEG_09657 [Aspergillus terreus NIH2624]EAU29848.1 hypothetical protein ATEG_09657 [Aspergillus terreus NIH2624]